MSVLPLRRSLLHRTTTALVCLAVAALGMLLLTDPAGAARPRKSPSASDPDHRLEDGPLEAHRDQEVRPLCQDRPHGHLDRAPRFRPHKGPGEPLRVDGVCALDENITGWNPLMIFRRSYSLWIDPSRITHEPPATRGR